MPAISPANVADWQRNDYYKTEEEYLFAIAEAMREEYKAIVDAGFLLQIDDPRLVIALHRAARREHRGVPQWASVRVEALNHALRDIPRETASATTPATASTWGRASTTWSSSTSSTSC